jgi:hypothetical protein
MGNDDVTARDLKKAARESYAEAGFHLKYNDMSAYRHYDGVKEQCLADAREYMHTGTLSTDASDRLGAFRADQQRRQQNAKILSFW